MELIKDEWYHVNVKRNTYISMRHKMKYKRRLVKANTSFRYSQAEFITKDGDAVFFIHAFGDYGYAYINANDIKIKHIPLDELHLGKDSHFSQTIKFKVYSDYNV